MNLSTNDLIVFDQCREIDLKSSGTLKHEDGRVRVFSLLGLSAHLLLFVSFQLKKMVFL